VHDDGSLRVCSVVSAAVFVQPFVQTIRVTSALPPPTPVTGGPRSTATKTRPTRWTITTTGCKLAPVALTNLTNLLLSFREASPTSFLPLNQARAVRRHNLSARLTAAAGNSRQARVGSVWHDVWNLIRKRRFFDEQKRADARRRQCGACRHVSLTLRVAMILDQTPKRDLHDASECCVFGEWHCCKSNESGQWKTPFSVLFYQTWTLQSEINYAQRCTCICLISVGDRWSEAW